MNKIHPIIKGGLTDLPEKLPGETPDFAAVAVFGTVRAQDLPTGNFMVAPPQDIDDQGDEDFCVLSASTSVSEDQEMTPLEYYFNAFVAKVLMKKDPGSWGIDLRTGMMSHVKYGALELELSPFKDRAIRPSRDEVLDEKTWDNESIPLDNYLMLAAEHRKNSMFEVETGPHDRFDNMRAQLWLHRSGFRSIATGCKWRPSWTDAEGGVIPETGWEDESVTPHAFKVCGQQYFDGVPYLKAQLSNSPQIGDAGFFYFPRSVVNREFVYGAFMFNDMPRADAEAHLYYGTKVTDGFFTRLIKIISRIVADLFV